MICRRALCPSTLSDRVCHGIHTPMSPRETSSFYRRTELGMNTSSLNNGLYKQLLLKRFFKTAKIFYRYSNSRQLESIFHPHTFILLKYDWFICNTALGKQPSICTALEHRHRNNSSKFFKLYLQGCVYQMDFKVFQFSPSSMMLCFTVIFWDIL